MYKVQWKVLLAELFMKIQVCVQDCHNIEESNLLEYMICHNIEQKNWVEYKICHEGFLICHRQVTTYELQDKG